MAEMIGLTWCVMKQALNSYVHVTDESLVNAIHQFERATPAIYEKRA